MGTEVYEQYINFHKLLQSFVFARMWLFFGE